MRVWIIKTGEPIPGVDGAVRAWRATLLASELAGRGHEVTLWTSRFDHFSKRQRPSEECESVLGARMRVVFVEARGYKRNISLARIRHHRKVAEGFRALSQEMPVPELVFCSLPTLELCSAAAAFCRERGRALVIDIRDVWPDVYLTALPVCARGLFRPLLWREYGAARKALSSAAALVAVSESYLTWGLRVARRCRCEDDAVYPLGYQDPIAGQGSSEAATGGAAAGTGRLTACFAGTFGRSYDLETVVTAARIQMDAGRARWRFVIAGSGDGGERLAALATGLPNMELTGWLAEADLRGVIGGATVGLAAYVQGAEQSIPNKFIEYMAFGLPIVSSLEGEGRALLEGEGIGVFYEPGNALALDRALRSLAEDEEGRRAMARRARSLYERRFSARAVYASLADHLEAIAEGYRGRPGRAMELKRRPGSREDE